MHDDPVGSALAPVQPMLPLDHAAPVSAAGASALPVVPRIPSPVAAAPAGALAAVQTLPPVRALAAVTTRAPGPGTVTASDGAVDIDEDGAAGPTPPRPEVEVRISTRRRKSASAFWSDGRVVVVLPAAMPRSARAAMVEDLVQRVLNYRPHIAASDGDLATRAAELADRYLGGVRPSSIRWVANQNSQWGSCTFGTAAIRISDRLRVVPGWVLDAVLVHELAHLLEPNHSPRFRELADRYTRSREADVFLDGFSLGREYAR